MKAREIWGAVLLALAMMASNNFGCTFEGKALEARRCSSNAHCQMEFEQEGFLVCMDGYCQVADLECPADDVEELYRDRDGDSYGDENRNFCPDEERTGYVDRAGDCDDLDSNVNPGKTEVPGNGLDDDCNPDTPDRDAVVEDTSPDAPPGDVENDTEMDADSDLPDVEPDVAEDADADVPEDADVDACDSPNECGGCNPLAAAVGELCGTCDTGRWACGDDMNTLVCQGDRGEAALNQCGGCAELEGIPREPCGTCDTGTWQCSNDLETVTCVGDRAEDALNVCRGCASPPEEFDGHALGENCGECGIWACSPQQVPACVGDEDCPERCEDDPRVDQACGTCDTGVFACQGNVLFCSGDEGMDALDVCGGCEEMLPGSPGENCGECGRYACEELELVCNEAAEVDAIGQPCEVGEGVCRVTGEFECTPGRTVECSEMPLPPPELTEETCDGEADNDCDGIDDELDPDCDECVDGNERPCYTGAPETRGQGRCQDGRQTCINRRWENACHGEVTPQQEICDTFDNDCDGGIDEDVTNVCGGCQPLPQDRIINQACGACGTWQCEGEEAVECDDPGLNACDSCGELQHLPGTECGLCGTYACNEEGDATVCIDQGLNACMGCGLLEHPPEEACGDCGEYVCNDELDATICSDPGLNACDGCGLLTNIPGDACGECGEYVCNDELSDTLCDDPGFNACGGCDDLPEGFTIDGACGECGVWACHEDGTGFCNEPEECGVVCSNTVCPSHPQSWPAECNAQDWCEYTPEGEPLKAEIFIPASTSFMMGSPAGEPGRRPDGAEGNNLGQPVTMTCVSAYFMRKYPITAAEYTSCEDAGECNARNAGDDFLHVGGNFPANGASRANAEEYCTYAGLRLPTEAEWELVANGPGAHRIHPWGNTPIANCGLTTMDDDGHDPSGIGCGTGSPRAVTAAPAGVSPVGAIDMVGNTLEWVAGCGGADLTNQPPDCSTRTQDCGNGTDYVLKGARFNARTDRVTNTLRTAYRGITSADFSDGGTGIRCARSAN